MAAKPDNEPVDVLIIGAGASGAAVAWNLTETRMRILCLEQGDWVQPNQYPTNRNDYEAQYAGPFHMDPNVRGLETDYPINVADSALDVLNFNGVGGSTILWAAHFPRLHPSDFRVRSLDGVAEDWPITYDDLEPYFAQNDQMMGVSGLAGDPMSPPHEPPLPPLPIGRIGEVVAGGFNKLGWHWWPSDSRHPVAPASTRGGTSLVSTWAPASSGCCAQGAKASTDVTPIGRRPFVSGVELRTHCRVREVTGRRRRAWPTGVDLLRRRRARSRFQAAEIVILACNGIGTPPVCS